MVLEVIDVLDADCDTTQQVVGAAIDVSFKKIMKNKASFLIWRIQNLSLIAVPREQYGTFFETDSYIIYAATSYGNTIQTQGKDIRGRPEFHVHFWLGTATNAEKAGIAAYKTVELDSYLGGSTTQHREVQGEESPRFKSYFLNGIKILKANISLNLKQINSYLTPTLYQIKGKRAPIIIQMSSVSWEHFNSADIFLLQSDINIFLWIGRASSPLHKLHGTKVAIAFRDEYSLNNIVFVDDGYEKTMYDKDKLEFELYLPLNKRIVKPASELEENEITDKQYKTSIKLYQCSDNYGKYRVTEIKSGPLKQEDLCSDDVFILDHGCQGIWVWVGRRVNEKERTEAMRNARGFVKKKKYPSQTPVTRVVDGIEPMEFKALFSVWIDKEELKQFSGHRIAIMKVTRYDAATMHERQAISAKSQLIDDGSGTIRILRIKRFETVEIPKERNGLFFTADCYIVLYNYQSVYGPRWIIYYWFGYHSSLDEQSATAVKIAELDKNCASNKSIQARIVQGKEPAHFLQLFGGKMRVFSGKGTDYDISGKNIKTPNQYMLLVQGSTPYNSKATQVPLKSSALNSCYCFVIRKGSTYYIWCGSNSTGDNREMAKNFVGADFTLLLEGNEPPEFWSMLGGKTDYNCQKLSLDLEKVTVLPRLFQCCTSFSYCKDEEILNFSQQDLTPEDIMLLDARDVVYMWIGDLSVKEEQKFCMQTAMEYLKSDPSGRDLKTAIFQIKQGYEPPTFTGFFPNWDHELWKNHESYDKIRRQIERNCPYFIHKVPSNEINVFDNYDKYPVRFLQGSAETLPGSVDPLRKELHLTYDDFIAIFGMNYEAFEKLPLWKRKQLKKNVGLF